MIFLYLLGETQTAFMQAKPEIFAFSRQEIGAIPTPELEQVLAEVFGHGHLFPGPEQALAAILHEFVARSCEQLGQAAHTIASTPAWNGCIFLSAFKKLDGRIHVRLMALIPLPSGHQAIKDEHMARQLIIHALPTFQHMFTQEAPAPDSQLVRLIQEAAVHHINQKIG